MSKSEKILRLIADELDKAVIGLKQEGVPTDRQALITTLTQSVDALNQIADSIDEEG